MPKTLAKIGKAVFSVTLKPLASLFGLKIPKQKTVQRPYKQSVSSRRSAFGAVKVGGPYALYEAVDKDSVDVVALLQGKSNQFLQFYLNDDKVEIVNGSGGVECPEDDRKYGTDRVRLFYRLGEPTETAYDEITAIYPTWDADHRGDGVTSIGLICRQAKDSKQNERFPNGLPEPSAAIEAQLIFDPREVSHAQGDKSTYEFSKNPALALLAFLTDAEGGMGLDYDRVIAPQEASWIAAADDCDLAEATVDGSEPRYQCGGAYDHDTAPGDVVKAILSSMDGMLDPAGDGSFVLHPGRYVAPSVTITDRMVKAYTLDSALPDEQAANVLVLRYTDPTADFNEGDAGEVRDEDDIEARGKERAETVDLDWVQSPSQAVRLGFRRLARSVQPLRGTLVLNMMGLVALGERYLQLQVDDHAALADLAIERTSAIRVDLGAQELSFAWVAAETTVDDGDPGAGTPQPGTPDPRPQPEPLAAPTITDLTASYEDSGGGVAGARILVDVDAPIDADVTWLLRWKLSADSDWHEAVYSDIADGAAVQLITGFVTATGPVDVQVAYRTAGATSPWSATETITLDAPVFSSATVTASEDLAAGAFVNFHDASGAKVRRAQVADDTKPATGFVKAAVTAGDPARVFPLGQVNDAVAGMTPGALQYLAADGAITEAVPSSGLLQVVGQAASPTELFTLSKDPTLL